MKKVKYCFLTGLIILIISFSGNAQNYNWAKLDSVNNLARIYTGLDHSFAFGLHYGRILNGKKVIWAPFADVSFPSGDPVGDDYNFKIGTLARLFQFEDWKFSFNVSIVNRQNSNPFVKMQSLGSESGFQFGYYKLKWYANLNFSVGSSIVTNFQHTEAYKGNFSGAKDGWYENASNSQLFSVNTGYSLRKMDATLSLGLLRTEEFKSSPSLPYYIKIGLNYLF
ncbi:hypothetical protein D0X99_16315 [Algoriphagus lacus]|uniref:Outer membrane protein beta-barrel domain-containing protein n=1 Tax=Algoriphagus lacus TaxID=2056311 RepID=A0A418PNQ0_9BACT|nr:hypothetical protein [Algoriphagus lacus]RIW13340.1 hypothetical protein D0X99_16315 [Algoriphagus lacus]